MTSRNGASKIRHRTRTSRNTDNCSQRTDFDAQRGIQCRRFCLNAFHIKLRKDLTVYDGPIFVFFSDLSVVLSTLFVFHECYQHCRVGIVHARRTGSVRIRGRQRQQILRSERCKDSCSCYLHHRQSLKLR